MDNKEKVQDIISDIKNSENIETTKVKSKIDIRVIVISVIISLVIFFSIEAFLNASTSIDDFTLSTFSLETEKTNYTTIDNYYFAIGTATISCSDTYTDYVVLVEIHNNTTSETTYEQIIVHNGKGTVETYDTYTVETEKPDYKIELLSFRAFYK